MTISNPAVARPSVRCSLSHDSFIARAFFRWRSIQYSGVPLLLLRPSRPFIGGLLICAGGGPNNSRGQEELLLNRRKEAAFEGRQLKLKASRHRPK